VDEAARGLVNRAQATLPFSAAGGLRIDKYASSIHIDLFSTLWDCSCVVCVDVDLFPLCV
jgi:hypothetical protein